MSGVQKSSGRNDPRRWGSPGAFLPADGVDDLAIQRLATLNSLHRRNQLLHTVDRSDELLNAVHLLHNNRLGDDLLNDDTLTRGNHTLTHHALPNHNTVTSESRSRQRGERNQSK